MVALSQDQQQSYMNLINQANLSRGKHKAAKGLLQIYSSSSDELNEKLSARIGIDIKILQAISNPAPAVPVQEPVQEIAPAPAPTPEAVVEAQQEPVSLPEFVPEPVVVPEVAQKTVIELQQAPVILEAVEKTPPTLNKYQLRAKHKPVEKQQLDNKPVPVEKPIEETPPTLNKYQLKAQHKVKPTPVENQQLDNKPVPVEKPVEEAAPKPQADNKTYKVVLCSENEAGKVVANAAPTIISKNNPKSFLEGIAKCSSLVNNDKLSYISTNSKCELPSSGGEAKAMCYLEILPSDITVPSSDHVTPIYSCSYNGNSYQKGGAPFAYISKTDLGSVDQVHDCADWALKGGESLAIGNGVCSAFYPGVDSALAGCLSNLSHLI